MIYSLPTKINIDGIDYQIRNKGDYRVILDVIAILNDENLKDFEKVEMALSVFFDGDIDEYYNNDSIPQNYEKAIDEILKFINCGDEPKNDDKPKIMDWDKDFWLIAPEVNKVLGYEIRAEETYTHWYTFIGGYMGIGEGTFQTFIGIRKKIQKGKKLDSWEKELYEANFDKIDLNADIKNDWLDGED